CRVATADRPYGQFVGQAPHQQDATLISAAVNWNTLSSSSSSNTVTEGRSYAFCCSMSCPPCVFGLPLRRGNELQLPQPRQHILNVLPSHSRHNVGIAGGQLLRELLFRLRRRQFRPDEGRGPIEHDELAALWMEQDSAFGELGGLQAPHCDKAHAHRWVLLVS